MMLIQNVCKSCDIFYGNDCLRQFLISNNCYINLDLPTSYYIFIHLRRVAFDHRQILKGRLTGPLAFSGKMKCFNTITKIKPEMTNCSHLQRNNINLLFTCYNYHKGFIHLG